MSTPAGIARSLTTRINRKKSVTDGAGSNGGLSRAFSMKRQERPAPRPEISLPIELVSATNPLAFNAPDLPQNSSASPAFSPTQKQLNAVASSNSLRSDGSVPALSSATSATFTFSGVSTPTEEVPETPILDLHNRLASPTEAPVETPSSPKSDRSFSSNKARSPLSEEAAPAVPKRAPSHTKKTHQAFARQRSQSRVRSTEGQDASDDTRKSSNSSSSASQHLSAGSGKDALVARTSADMFSAHNHNTSIDSNHPFGAELAKLTEVAEQFSPRRAKAEGLSFPRDRSVSSPRTNLQPPTPKTPVPKKMMRKQRPAIEPTVWDEELEYLSKHGLRTFSAEEYMAEIGSPYMSSFPGSPY